MHVQDLLIYLIICLNILCFSMYPKKIWSQGFFLLEGKKYLHHTCTITSELYRILSIRTFLAIISTPIFSYRRDYQDHVHYTSCTYLNTHWTHCLWKYQLLSFFINDYPSSSYLVVQIQWSDTHLWRIFGSSNL